MFLSWKPFSQVCLQSHSKLSSMLSCLPYFLNTIFTWI
jgi:hypothetical protein